MDDTNEPNVDGQDDVAETQADTENDKTVPTDTVPAGKVNEDNVVDKEQHTNNEVKQSFEDTNVISETTVPITLAPNEDTNKDEPLVPANSEYQTSVASIHLPEVAAGKS